MASRVVKGLELGALAVLAVGLVVGVVKLRAQEGILEARTHALTDRYNARAGAALPRFLRDAETLRSQRLFLPPERSHDAGTFLNQALPWRAGGVEITPGPRSLTLPAPLEHKLDGWGTYWVAQVHDVDVVALDPSPLEPISSATHWSLAEGEGRPDALPDFTLLQQWAKLLLLRGAHQRQQAEALGEVEHLAELCASTETLEGELAALGMLELEQKFLGRQETNLTRRRRVLWGAVSYAAPFVEPGVQQQAQQVVVGRCAAHDEASTFESIRLALQLPASRIPSPSGCHLARTRALQATLPMPPGPLARLIGREPLLRGWPGKLRLRLFPEQCARLLQALAANETGLRLLEEPTDEPVLEQVHRLR